MDGVKKKQKVQNMNSYVRNLEEGEDKFAENTGPYMDFQRRSTNNRNSGSKTNNINRQRSTVQNVFDEAKKTSVQTLGIKKHDVHKVNNKNKKNKRRKGFRKFILFYSGVLLLLIIAGAVLLNFFLLRFQESQPNNSAAEFTVVYQDTESLISFLGDNTEKIVCIESPENVARAYAETYGGKKTSYMEDISSSGVDRHIYNIMQDGIVIGNIEVTKTGKGGFNLDNWGISRINIAGYIPGTKSFDIIVSEKEKIFVNGKELGEDYQTEKGVPEVLNDSLNFIKNPPIVEKYTVSGLTADPIVTVLDDNGEESRLTLSGNTFSEIGAATADFVEMVRPVVEAGIREWALYFINMSDRLSLYIVKDSVWYKSIFGGEDMQDIQTWLYNYEYIDSYEFLELKSDNYIVYTEDCFTCDISYNLKVTFTRGDLEDNNQNLRATWVWVRDGDSWSVSDVIYK